jgi:hypothetical protein
MLPANPQYEIVLEGKIDSASVPLHRFTVDRSLTITDELPEGSHIWEVNAYLQDRVEAAQYMETEIVLLQANDALYWKILEESDEIKRAKLIEKRDANLALIAAARSTLESLRTLLETKSISFVVDHSLNILSDKDNPALRIEGIEVVEVGERILIFAKSTTGFSGPDGAKEVIIRGGVRDEFDADVISFSVKNAGLRAFSFISEPTISGQLGEYNFSAIIYLRSASQASAIRNALSSAATERSILIKERDRERDPVFRQFYERTISDLGAMERALVNHLEDLLVPFGEPSVFAFEIVPSALATFSTQGKR